MRVVVLVLAALGLVGLAGAAPAPAFAPECRWVVDLRVGMPGEVTPRQWVVALRSRYASAVAARFYHPSEPGAVAMVNSPDPAAWLRNNVRVRLVDRKGVVARLYLSGCTDREAGNLAHALCTGALLAATPGLRKTHEERAAAHARIDALLHKGKRSDDPLVVPWNEERDRCQRRLHWLMRKSGRLQSASSHGRPYNQKEEG